MKIVEPKKIAKAALINNEGQILILTRSEADRRRAGRFDFPGGGVDEGESPDEAIVREIQEELRVQLNENDLTLAFSHTSYFEAHSAMRFLYVGRIEKTTKITLSHEHSDYEWMTLKQAIAKHQHPVWIDGLTYLLDHSQLSV